MTINGLVLAGGESRRMGCDKAQLRHGELSQLEYVAAVLGEVADAVFVSTRESQAGDSVRSRFENIVDRYDELGPVAGILSALEAYPESDWLIVACDLPNVDVATLHYLIQHSDPAYPFTAFTSSHDGLPEPLCAIYRKECTTILRQFVADGLKCPRKMLIRSNTQLLEQIDPMSLENVNSPGDLEASVLRSVS